MFFPYRLDPTYRLMLAPLRLDDDDGVTLTDDTFTATFGPKRLQTPLTNVVEAHATYDYRWFKAIGMRLSFADDGLTFGTSTYGGVCVHFDERVRRVIGLKDHSALTVTVEDLDGLVTAINDRAG
ncbi:MAG: hypothetical protein AAF081_10720 [Actinomycetota bacterium]